MEIIDYIIFGFCILGVGYTSYNIGLKEGIKLGALLDGSSYGTWVN